MFSLSLLSAFFVFFTSAFKEKVYQMYSCHSCAMSYFSCCSNTSLPSPVIGRSWWPKAGDILLQWRDHRLFKGILLHLCPPQGHAVSTTSSQSRRLGSCHRTMWLSPSAPGCGVQECTAAAGKGGCRLGLSSTVVSQRCTAESEVKVPALCQYTCSRVTLLFDTISSRPLQRHCLLLFFPLRCCLCLFRAQWTFPIRFPFFRFQVCLSLKAGQVLGRAGMHRSIDFLPLGSLECFPGLAVALGCPAGQAN